MTEVTRRSLLTGAAAAAAIAPLAAGLPTRAAAPPANAQAPGWYRYKVGSFEERWRDDCPAVADPWRWDAGHAG